eukprot:3832426-Amphidinium_carterae.1
MAGTRFSQNSAGKSRPQGRSTCGVWQDALQIAIFAFWRRIVTASVQFISHFSRCAGDLSPGTHQAEQCSHEGIFPSQE